MLVCKDRCFSQVSLLQPGETSNRLRHAQPKDFLWAPCRRKCRVTGTILLETGRLFIALSCRRIRFQVPGRRVCYETSDAFVDRTVGLCRLQQQASQTSSLVRTVKLAVTSRTRLLR